MGRTNMRSYEVMLAHYGSHNMLRRAAYSIAIVVSVLLIGTVVLHHIEGYSYIDAFYFMSMLATAQGPTTAPATTLGKLFVSFMAFVSVGAVVVALGFIFGPLFGMLLRIGERRLEKEEKVLVRDIDRYRRRL